MLANCVNGGTLKALSNNLLNFDEYFLIKRQLDIASCIEARFFEMLIEAANDFEFFFLLSDLNLRVCS